MLTPDKAAAAEAAWHDRCFQRFRGHISRNEEKLVAAIDVALVQAYGRVDIVKVYNRLYDICDSSDDVVEFSVALGEYIRRKYSPEGWLVGYHKDSNGLVVGVDLDPPRKQTKVKANPQQVPVQTVTYVSWVSS